MAGLSVPGRIDHLLAEIKATLGTAEEVFESTASPQAKRYLELNLQSSGE